MGFGSGGEGFTPGRNNLVGNFTVEGQISGSLGITGSSFTGDGSNLTNVGGGSLTITIGNTVASGASNRLLYEDSSNELAENSSLTFDGTVLGTPALSGSSTLKVVGAAQFASTVAATGSLSSSVGLSGSAVKADGVISGSAGSYSSLLSNTTLTALTGLTGSSAKISGDISGSIVITRNLTLDGTAVSSTAAELNLLDGVSAVTISGVSLGGTLGSLSKASNSGLALTSYNGSSAVSDLAVDLDSLAVKVVDVANDSIAILDATDDTSGKESIADLATGMAGTGLSAASGQLTVDASQTQITAVGTIATGVWNGTAVANANLANSTVSGIALGSTLGALSKATNSGLALTSYDGSAAVSDLAIDFSDLTEATVNVAADSIMFLDNDGAASRRDTIADLMSAAAGTGLSESSGQLTVNASQTQITAVGTVATGDWQATDVAVAHGGTGASTEGDARTNLGLVIGTNVLAQQTIGIADDNLVEVDGTITDDDFAKWTANGLEGRSYSETRSDLGLVINTNVQAWDAELDTLSGIGSAEAGALVALTQTEIEILDGATVTSAELNLLDASVVTEPADGPWAAVTRWAKVEFDPTTNSGERTVGEHDLSVTLPDNAVVVGGFVDVVTVFVSNSGADDATIALHLETANDIVTAVAISATTDWDVGLHSVIPAGTGATAIKLTAATSLKATVAVEALDSGKAVIWLQYVISEA